MITKGYKQIKRMAVGTKVQTRNGYRTGVIVEVGRVTNPQVANDQFLGAILEDEKGVRFGLAWNVQVAVC